MLWKKQHLIYNVYSKAEIIWVGGWDQALEPDGPAQDGDRLAAGP